MALKYKAPEVTIQDEPFDDGPTNPVEAQPSKDVINPVTAPVTQPAQVPNPAEAAAPGTHNPDIGPNGIDLSGIPTHQDGRPLNMRARLDLHHHQEIKKRLEQIEAARRKPIEPPKSHVTMPVAPAIRAQTERELAAGRAASAAHAAQQALRTYVQKPEPWEGTNVPVHRSSDFTEEKDPKKKATASQPV